jgi:glycosyltransferase involved in cell wall biosynthesis
MYGPRFTGIGSYTRHLLEHLLRAGRDNTYSVFHMPDVAVSVPPEARSRVTLRPVTARHYSVAEQTWLRFTLASVGADLIHVPHFNAPIGYRGPSVVTIHDTTPLGFTGKRAWFGLRRIAYRAVFRSALRRARIVIAVSEFTKQDVLRHFRIDDDKIQVVHEGVDARFTPLPEDEERERILAKHGIRRPYVYYSGTWRPHKNITGLVRAFAKLVREDDIPHALVLGGKRTESYVEPEQVWNACGIADRVLCPGMVPFEDLPALYSAADVFVQPSFLEGFGLMPLEAMACGTPTVTANVASLPEVVGNASRMVDPHDTDSLADGIRDVLTNADYRAGLVARGAQRASQFTWEKAARETLDVYRQALGG